MHLAAQTQSSGGYTFLIMMVLLFVLFYFLAIRPQQRRRRELDTMQSKIAPGDEVITVGGMHGIVSAIEDDAVLLEIAPEVTVRYARAAIARMANQAGRPDDGTETTADKIVEPD